MIKNEREYEITKKQRDKFREALKGLSGATVAEQMYGPLLGKAIESQLTDLEAEIRVWEAKRTGNLPPLLYHNTDEECIEAAKQWGFEPENITDAQREYDKLLAVEEQLRVRLGLSEAERPHVRMLVEALVQSQELPEDDMVQEWLKYITLYHHNVLEGYRERTNPRPKP
jgi:hypothetical protein